MRLQPKKGEFRTGFVKRERERESYMNWSCSKGVIGSLFIYYLYFYLSTWLIGGVCFGRLEKGVLGAGPTRRKGGLRCGSGKNGGSLPWHVPILNIYVSAPPPPPGLGYDNTTLFFYNFMIFFILRTQEHFWGKNHFWFSTNFVSPYYYVFVVFGWLNYNVLVNRSETFIVRIRYVGISLACHFND